VRLRALRAERALTRSRLAESSGVSLAYLARLEAGRANISLAVLEQLARALAVPPESLIADVPVPGSELAAVVAMLAARPSDVHVQVRAWIASRWPDPTGLPLRRPRRIALVGLRGAGKSTLGPRLARELGVPFVELNREIERAGGLSVTEVFTLYGTDGYRRLQHRCLEEVCAGYDAVVLATGGGLVQAPATYALLRREFTTVWLHATPDEHFARVRRQQDERITAPELREAAMANIARLLQARRPLHEQADLRLDTTGRTPARSTRELLRLVLDAQGRAAPSPD
jgi:XRE family aerobic/anaerobic benzoate catabolism transcriptional regulator